MSESCDPALPSWKLLQDPQKYDNFHNLINYIQHQKTVWTKGLYQILHTCKDNNHHLWLILFERLYFNQLLIIVVMAWIHVEYVLRHNVSNQLKK